MRYQNISTKNPGRAIALRGFQQTLQQDLRHGVNRPQRKAGATTLNHGRNHKSNDRHQFDENVERGAGGVLKGISYGITYNRCLVWF